MDDRSAVISMGGDQYELLLTVYATKQISKKYHGLEDLSSKLMRGDDAVNEMLWLINLLANQAISAHNFRFPGRNKSLITAEFILPFIISQNIGEYYKQINNAIGLGAERFIQSEAGIEKAKKRTGRVNDEETFARLIFYGVSLLNRSEQEVWLMPMGHLLDQWEIYKQFNKMAEPKCEHFIDDIIPYGL